MVATNGLAVMLAGIILSILAGKEKKGSRHDLKNISQSFQRWLLICVTAGFLMTTIFTWALQTELAKNEAHDIIQINLEDVREDILEASNENLLKLARNISARIDSAENVDSDLLYSLEREYDVAEINLINPNGTVYVTVFMEFVVFGILFIAIYFLIKKLVVDNMTKINKSLAKITSGNLDTVVDVKTNEEFASLSDDINSTVLTLKRYIAEAAARIDRELEFAKTIQHSAIPSVFPPYPGHNEFDIFATMDTAKEVGGDFYDFYFVGENKFAFLIADSLPDFRVVT